MKWTNEDLMFVTMQALEDYENAPTGLNIQEARRHAMESVRRFIREKEGAKVERFMVYIGQDRVNLIQASGDYVGLQASSETLHDFVLQSAHVRAGFWIWEGRVEPVEGVVEGVVSLVGTWRRPIADEWAVLRAGGWLPW